jgi:TM2 domain-containing membrane protein YozV
VGVHPGEPAPLTIFPPPDIEQPATPAAAYAPSAKRLSAGRAWLLSSVLPGAGQLYCGATARGLATLAVLIVVVAVIIFVPEDPRWLAIRVLVFFYSFAGLDAYLTARDHNRGIEAEAPANPRVAALLNFTTSGIGYLYLGQKAGCLAVVVLGVALRVISEILPLVVEAVLFALAAHAAAMARRQRDESYPPDRLPPPVPSQLPAAVPYAVSGFVLLAYYGLVTFGQIMMFVQG